MDTLDQTRQETARRRSLAAFLVTLVLTIGLLYLGRLFFITLVSAILLSFILEPVVHLLMRLRLPRGVASFIACTLMLSILYLAGLGVWSRAEGFRDDLPTYSRRINDLVDTASLTIERMEKSAEELFIPKRLRQAQQPDPQAAEQARKTARSSKRRPVEPPMPPPVQEVRIKQDETPLVNALYQSLRSFSDVLLMASFVPFLVYFFLSWRDHLRRSVLHLATGEAREMVERAWDGIGNVARAYVVGNFLLGLLLTFLSALFFWVAKVPYWEVAAPLSGFLSLVPYLGLPLSLLPPFIAMLPAYTGWTAYLVVGTTVALFHLLALNLLYPKLVGSRVHLNPLVVTVAMMVWYLLWGPAGLVLAIPITAGMKAVFDSIPTLRGYGRLLGD